MPKVTANWRFHRLTLWDEVWAPAFLERWRGWLDNSFSAHVFFHPALVRAWVETNLPLRDIQPRFLIAESSEHTAFLPLVLWRRNWKSARQRLLVPVGHSDYDYHDPIVVGPAEGFSRTEFWGALQHELSGGRMGYDRLDVSAQPVTAPDGGPGWRTGECCPWADLTQLASPDDYLPSLGKSLRGDLRRQERRAEEVGPLSYHVFTTAEMPDALAELPAFLAAHAQRWPQAYKAPRFHENLVRHALEAGVLHFSTLRVGDATAAWHLGFVFRDRFYYYLPAQRPEFNAFSPGKLLLLRCVQDAIARRLAVFDHLRGEESYKAGWTDSATTLRCLRLDTSSLAGRVRNAMVDTVKPRLMGLALCTSTHRFFSGA